MALKPPHTILDSIGHTTLLPLRHVVPKGSARILLKLENENPTGSMKDRMALSMIETPEWDGRLEPERPVVEYTGGSTGVSLSLVCAVKGHPLFIVTSDAFSKEKLDHMKILGAKLEIIPSVGGGMTEKLTKDMIARAGEIAKETGAYWTDQMKNQDQLPAYHRLAEELWTETDGKIDAFVQFVGTCGSLRGTAEGLKRRNEMIRMFAVEPAESQVLSGGKSGAHKIDGVGAGFVVPMWKPELVEAIEQVSTADSTAMALRLAREEGLFAGTSTGGNVVAALRVAERLGEGATVVTLMVDSGMKYLKKFGDALA
jgi:cysteine synthase A